jgi:2-dehydropantoate 2-reductase
LPADRQYSEAAAEFWSMEAKRIAIVGAGAIGGYFGARMIAAGHDVTLIDAWPEHVAHVRRHGLTVEEMPGQDRLCVPADIRDIGQVQQFVREAPLDIACIAVKSYDTAWATQLILPWLAPDGVLVSLQNSFNEPTIAAIAGTERTFGCAIAALACDLVAPGLVRRMAPDGSLGLGAMAPGRAAMAAELAMLFDCVEKSRPLTDLAAAKWSKLVINAMRNGLSAMTGMTGRERDSHPTTIALGMRLGAQTVRVGRAMGLELIDTGYDFDALVATETGDAAAIEAIRRRMAEIAAGRSSDQRPSMAQDIRKGRRTETEAINGLVARRGRELGIDTRPHQMVHERILRIERGELAPSPALAEGIL